MKIEGLSKSFGKKTILDEIDLTIKKGKLTAFIGPNGAGKSTLLTTMSRLIATETGAIYLNGQDLKSFKTRISTAIIYFETDESFKYEYHCL